MLPEECEVFTDAWRLETRLTDTEDLDQMFKMSEISHSTHGDKNTAVIEASTNTIN